MRKRVVLLILSGVTALSICFLIIFHQISGPNTIDKSIKGLPVENYSLADVHVNELISFVHHYTLSDFFSSTALDMFAFVRVAGVKQWVYDDSENWIFNQQVQTSTMKVLSVLWSRDGRTPKTISTLQFRFGRADGRTNLLRKGGVYLLPLSYSEYFKMWQVMGNLDVLFEVDDKGQVWSHSPRSGFNRFDGEDARVLADAVTTFMSDENLSAAITSFGNIARSWGVLAETTVLYFSPKTDQWDNECYLYTLRVDNILSIPSNVKYSWLPKDGDERITRAIYTTVYFTDFLDEGGRYLILLESRNDEPSFQMRMIAAINEDGTITGISFEDEPMYYESVFEEYNGYTLAQMKDEAERAKAWHEVHDERQEVYR